MRPQRAERGKWRPEGWEEGASVSGDTHNTSTSYDNVDDDGDVDIDVDNDEEYGERKKERDADVLSGPRRIYILAKFRLTFWRWSHVGTSRRRRRVTYDERCRRPT